MSRVVRMKIVRYNASKHNRQQLYQKAGVLLICSNFAGTVALRLRPAGKSIFGLSRFFAFLQIPSNRDNFCRQPDIC